MEAAAKGAGQGAKACAGVPVRVDETVHGTVLARILATLLARVLAVGARLLLPVPLCLLLLCGSNRVLAAEALVAVAANFLPAARELAAAFEHSSGHKLVLSAGSTGKLYAQIVHGAPFEVLLAADQQRPLLLEQQGLALAGSRFTYARGRLVLFSPDPALVDAQASILRNAAAVGKLAIANPKIAPYGLAAQQTMQALGVYESLRGQLVQGENIAQAWQFVDSGNARLGLVARSQVQGSERGSHWVVPETLHAPIRQDAVLLTRGSSNAAASAFLQYLQGEQARAIIRNHGYDLERECRGREADSARCDPIEEEF
ncbi:MAG: molybdate ABC transporter substrate-binding protein [Gammaproteobacteria bacterium]|nr:molybdate ABC transporter substrate-binding protein [Gammaproteobacteria bacterium]